MASTCTLIHSTRLSRYLELSEVVLSHCEGGHPKSQTGKSAWNAPIVNGLKGGGQENGEESDERDSTCAVSK